MEADKVIFKQYELDNEIWKDIPNYENLYQVSDLGRVRRLPNRIITKRGSKVIGAKILNQNFDKNKYVGVSLSKNSKVVRFKTHRLVMLVFCGESHLHVDHINGIKDDNRLLNLRYCTNRENSAYYFSNLSTASKLIGAHKAKYNKWASNIRILGKQYYLGVFTSEILAHKAYLEALDNWEKSQIMPNIKNTAEKELKQALDEYTK